MHIIKPYEAAVTLFQKNGAARHFSSKSAALKALGRKFIADKVGPDFHVFVERTFLAGAKYAAEIVYEEFEFVMRDDFGGKLVFEHFYDLLPQRKKLSRWARMYGSYSGVGAVPGTGRGRSHCGTYYRRPKTTHDRRWSQAVDDDIAPRPSRRVRGLPSAWDDFCRSDFKDKSWKRFRKFQYKVGKTGH